MGLGVYESSTSRGLAPFGELCSLWPASVVNLALRKPNRPLQQPKVKYLMGTGRRRTRLP